MDQTISLFVSKHLRCLRPDAIAWIKGSDEYPDIFGQISFCQTERGVIVVSEVWRLPSSGVQCMNNIFAMHIHAGGSCTGTAENPFANADGHFNPNGCEHPEHAGDLPPLFSNGGTAWSAVLTDRFTVRSILGKTVIIHLGTDDFKTQPSGNSGKMIACGVIG